MNVYRQNNLVYSKQFFLLAFIGATAFKVVMLPQYLSVYTGRTAWIAMLAMMAVELAELLVIYRIVRCYSLIDAPIPVAARIALCLLIAASCLIKGSVLTTEFSSYVANAMFDRSEILYVLLALIPACVYFAYKGGNTLGRAAEILFWIIAVAFLFNILFARYDGDLGNLSPIEPDGNVAVAIDRHFMWFGDYTPFLFLTVTPSSKKSRIFSLIAVLAALAVPVALMIVVTTIYGGAAVSVSNVFGKIAVFNKISSMLGTVDLPTVCAWLVMALLRLSMILYALVSALCSVLKKRGAVAFASGLSLGLIVLFGMKNIDTSYKIATGYARYFVCAVEYLAPFVLYILLRIYSPEFGRAHLIPAFAAETASASAKPHANSTGGAADEIV